MRNGNGETAILFAGSSKDVNTTRCIEYLIKAGADVSGKDVIGLTTLMQAARNGFDNYLKLVPKSSMDINAKARNTGMSGLFYAVEASNVLEAGADVNDVTSTGHTILQWAVMYDSVFGAIDRDAGADVNKTDTDGNATPLILAVGQSKIKCVNTLVNAGADVNKAVGSGITALCTAATKRSTEIITILLRQGFHINKPSLENNALIAHLSKSCPVNHGIVILLYVAGEDVFPTSLTSSLPLIPFLLDIKQNLQLKHICREAIRKHLLQMSPHDRLFGRMPRLGLPPSLTAYLLYNLSLEVDAIAMETALKTHFHEEMLHYGE